MSIRLLLLTGLWLFAVGAGFAILQNYSVTPGNPGKPTPNWPRLSQIKPDATRATLVMAVHPHCPCSRASIASLAKVMARSQGAVTAYVLVYKPKECAPGWEQTDLWRSAGAIPGVTVMSDEDGLEAQRFGAATSGETQLYAPAGNLLFSGGITIARGHEGENAGLDAVVAYSTVGKADRSHCPVYGCPIQAANSSNAQKDVP